MQREVDLDNILLLKTIWEGWLIIGVAQNNALIQKIKSSLMISTLTDSANLHVGANLYTQHFLKELAI